MSTPFYVSESFTHTISDFASTGQWHTPGPFNMEHVWGNNAFVDLELVAGEFGLVVYAGPSNNGINADVWMCLYDLSQVVNRIAQPVIIGGSPVGLYFLTQGGVPMAPANLMNAVCKYGEYADARRALKQPIRVGGVTTPTTGGPFQVGALMRFFGESGVLCAYQYFMQGSVLASSPPSPPPSSSNLTLTTPTGVNYSWPATPGIWTGMA